jgi:hypothetical protein
MYKICWRAKFTGAVGCSEPIFQTKEKAQEIVDIMNKERTYLEHWVEYVEVPPIVAFIESEM